MPKEVIINLFRNPTVKNTISSLSEELKRSKVGIWKTVKNLEKEEYIKLNPIGYLKRKVYLVKLNWDNPLVEKSLEMYLLEDALDYGEWTRTFDNLGNVLDFLILSKEENTDRIIGVTQKGKFVRIQKPSSLKVQNGKEIITSSVTNFDFAQGLNKKNEEYSLAVKKGVILFGQESFIHFMKKLQMIDSEK